MNRCGMVAVATCAALCSLGSIFAAIYILKEWKTGHPYVCPIYILHDRWDDDDDYTPSHYYCPYRVWAGIEFVGAIMWGVVAYCIAFFVYSGRYAKHQKEREEAMEEASSGRNTTVEMGVVTATPATAAVMIEPNISPEQDKINNADGV